MSFFLLPFLLILSCFPLAAWNYESVFRGNSREEARGVLHPGVTGTSLVHRGSLGYIPLNKTYRNCNHFMNYLMKDQQWCFQTVCFNIMYKSSLVFTIFNLTLSLFNAITTLTNVTCKSLCYFFLSLREESNT